jgi:hypothetical protein
VFSVKCDFCTGIHNSVFPIETVKDCNPYFQIEQYQSVKNICKNCISLHTKAPNVGMFGYTKFQVEFDWWFPKEGDVMILGYAYVEPFGKNTFIVKLTDGLINHHGEYDWRFQLLVKGESVIGDQARKYRDVAKHIVDLYKMKFRRDC